MNKLMIGSHIIELEQTTSTNSYAANLLHSGKQIEGTVIIACEQTQGKGMDQNVWESEANKNLTFSIILYPDFLDPAEQFRLTEIISLGITDFVKTLLPLDGNIKIKWPNDIYIGDRKLCGTLIQNSIIGNKLSESIVGIGLNVNQESFLSGAPNPVSLKQISGINYDLRQSLLGLCSFINIRYNQLKSKYYAKIESDYLSLLYRFDEWHDFIVQEKSVHARIVGITNYGQLKLESVEGDIYNCGMKEVVYCL
ncbi:MAG: biotin--[acetyl-CoA-carboxylase] ligase [Bacteroidota bacterium]|nr:biotin--[acetyl-CoA-carboxylase] ligase [Bacteroidota bacterium]